MFKKCKVVMLPSDKPTFISKGKMIPSIFYCPNTEVYDEDAEECQHLYIISDDEIKVGDWVLWMGILPKEFQITRVDKIDSTFERQRDECRKIIATTDSSLGGHQGTDYYPLGFQSLPMPSDSFIKKYCELGGINEVMVEYRSPYDPKDKDFWKSFGDKITINWDTPKAAPDNTITIKEVRKEWNSIEIAKLIRKYEKEKYQIRISDIEFNEWIKNNLLHEE